MATLDYEKAGSLLKELFTEAEVCFQQSIIPPVSDSAVKMADILFASATQSYREALLGCGLVKLLDHSVNIRHPYVNQGDDSFNGRTLDERIINPFLHEYMIPCSKGPYLASFRRSVKFLPETAMGLRDKEGYAALLDYIVLLEKADKTVIQALVVYLLYRFIKLRNAANIPLSGVSRLSLEQYQALIERLLHVQSGGLIPVLLTVAMLRTLKECFNLKWNIEWQGINVADKASGASGDVTVTYNGKVLLTIEITERPIEKSRVISTFNTKIVKTGIEDYLFMYTKLSPGEEAKRTAQTYFKQGHEINFLQIRDWIVHNLATTGIRSRENFIHEILELLDSREIPASIKMAWNNSLKEIISE